MGKLRFVVVQQRSVFEKSSTAVPREKGCQFSSKMLHYVYILILHSNMIERLANKSSSSIWRYKGSRRRRKVREHVKTRTTQVDKNITKQAHSDVERMSE